MPPVLTFLTTWRWDATALAVGLLLTVGYAAGLRAASRQGIQWPLHRTGCYFLLGVGSFAWVSFGFLGTFSSELRWAFTTRIALLLLVVPALLSLGRPVALAAAVLGDTGQRRLQRFLHSRLIRLSGNAVFEPVFSLALFLVFLTPLSGLIRTSEVGQAAVSVIIPLIGLMTVIPLVENTTPHTSFFVTVEFVLAFAAFVFDPIPGILLRINETVLDQVPAVTGAAAWFPGPLRDQQLSGDLLWFLAEVVDVPILILLMIRWNRIDRSEARGLDALSDAEMDALTQAHLDRGRRQDNS
jgi:putative membrane protein